MRIEAGTCKALEIEEVVVDGERNDCVTMVDDKTMEYSFWDLHLFPAAVVTHKAAKIQFDGKTIRIKSAP